MKWIRPWIALAAALALASPAGAQITNRIVAYVNDEIVTQGDVNLRLSGMLQDADPASIDPDRAEGMRKQMVQRLIDERLVLQEGKRAGVKVEPEEIDKRLEEIQKRLPNPESFQEMLQQSGINDEQLKAKLREQLLIQKTIDQMVRSKIRVTPAELSKISAMPETPAPAERQQVHAYHLLIRVTPQRTLEQAKAQVADLRKQIDEGADFREVARQYSEGPHAAEGGDLGWVGQGELLPELDRVLFKLTPGELSKPIVTPTGVHLVKVVEKGTEDAPEQHPVSDRQRREMRLYQQKFGEAMNQWLGKLKDKAYIKVVDE